MEGNLPELPGRGLAEDANTSGTVTNTDSRKLDRAQSREERRAAALADLLAKVEAGGGNVALTAQALGDEWGVPLVTVRTWLKHWVAKEAIKTRSLGPRGTSIEAGRQTKAKATRARNAAARTSGTTESPPSQTPRQAANAFCVWCGAQHKVQGARFCAACGKAVPG